MANDIEHFFHMSIGPLYVLLEKCLIKSFASLENFFNWVVCLSGVESYELFIYFGD